MGCALQFAPLVVGMSSSGGFRTPKSAAWSKGVTARAPVSGGSCKKIQCDNCETACWWDEAHTYSSTM